MIHVTFAGDVAVVTLDREPVNALDDHHRVLLDRAIDTVVESGARAVLVRSALAVFSAGADIAMIAERLADEAPGERMAAYAAALQAVYARIEDLPIPTVAAISGVAVGGGLELALACDVRLASDHARVGLPESQIGLIPGAGGTQRLTRIVGSSRSTRLLMTGDLIDATTALAWGIVDEVLAEGELDAAAMALAQRFAQVPSELSRWIKHCVALADDGRGYGAEIHATRALCDDPATLDHVRSFFNRPSRKAADLA